MCNDTMQFNTYDRINCWFSNIGLLKVKKFRKGQGGNLDFLNKDGEDDLNQGNTTQT